MKTKKNFLLIFGIFIVFVFIASGCAPKKNATTPQARNSNPAKYSQTPTPTPAPAPTPAEMPTPQILADDQILVANSIIIKKVLINALGWVVISRDEKDEANNIVGSAQVQPGVHENLKISIIATKEAQKLFATLHEDKGILGTLEFSQLTAEDAPIKIGGTVVMAGFQILPESAYQGGSVREIPMTAKFGAYEPPTITVNKGDLVRLIIKTADADHSIEIPDFNIKKLIEIKKTITVEFIADKAGTFPFFSYIDYDMKQGYEMKGEIIVK